MHNTHDVWSNFNNKLKNLEHNRKLGVEKCKNWINKLTHECHMSHAVPKKYIFILAPLTFKTI
jgi:hypothetical protein